MEEFEKYSLSNKKFTRRILFGRRSADEKSLLEEILAQPKLYSILGDIWKKFYLYSKPELLTLVIFLKVIHFKRLKLKVDVICESIPN